MVAVNSILVIDNNDTSGFCKKQKIICDIHIHIYVFSFQTKILNLFNCVLLQYHT